MYWKIIPERGEPSAPATRHQTHGRFVLHRHHDADGPHLDLRFEQDGYLSGFRVDALTLDNEVCASEKGAHPIAWLERDGDAVREDAGTYHRQVISENEMTIMLHGAQGIRVLRAVREPGLTPSHVRDVCAALHTGGASATDAARLIADGIAARRRATERLCGLARELDGAAFDEDVCRRSLAPLTLEDIHAQLRGYEARFDAKYPPAPVSRPERLPERSAADAMGKALEIARG
ncbi:MAG: hypothetical protein HUU46_02780 [Candidatus Hydrogenedentes bacterium]|nr:hypothetical protein [Candidatus Hydrogenedentota bacterium]